jgi:uncharacterized protein (DUF2132 family)
MSEEEKVQKGKDLLEGITLKMMVEGLRDHYGWEELADLIEIDCFYSNPSVRSSLNFLRKPKFSWARAKVERLYLNTDFREE